MANAAPTAGTDLIKSRRVVIATSLCASISVQRKYQIVLTDKVTNRPGIGAKGEAPTKARSIGC